MVGRSVGHTVGMTAIVLAVGIAAFPGRGMTYRPQVAHAARATLSARDREIQHRLDGFFRRLASHKMFSGAVLLQHGASIVYRHAFGYANREKQLHNNITTSFNLGSVDKMFTAVAIMQLVQEGKVSLDAPISRYLPDYPGPAGDEITVAELLTHTSGLGDYFQSPGFWSSDSQFLHPRDYFPYIVHEPLLFKPGSRFGYSNSGYVVLGAIVEAVSGEGYFGYLQAHIFDTAGMKHTGFYARTETAPDLAIGYTGPAGHRYPNTSLLPVRGGPAGGGYSTVTDLIAFADALQAHRLLDKQHTSMLTAPRVSVAPGQKYGYGIMSSKPGKVRAIGHNGGSPGVYSYLYVYLGTGYTAAVLSNFDPPTSGGALTAPVIYGLVSGAPKR